MTTAPTLSFQPGTKLACLKGRLLLFADVALSDPLALELWDIVEAGGGIDDIVGALFGRGLTGLPDFALVALGEQTAPLVVRGPFEVHVHDEGGEFHTTGHGILTDEIRNGLVSVWIAGPMTESGPRVPAVEGILPAAGVGFATPLVAGAETSGPEPTEAASPSGLSLEVPLPTVGTSPEENSVGKVPAASSDAAATPEPSALKNGHEALEVSAAYAHLFEGPGSAGNSPPHDPSTVAEAPSVRGAQDQPPAPGPTDVWAATAIDHPQPIAVVHDEPTVLPYASEPATAQGSGFIEEIPAFISGRVSPDASPTASPPSTPRGGWVADSAPIAPPHPVQPVGPLVSDPGPSRPVNSPAPTAGRTVNRAMLTQHVGPTVWAARCPLGHLSQAHASACRVCGQAMPAQEPQEVPRPVLGRLVAVGAPPIQLDSDLILGRDPKVPSGWSAPLPRLVILNDPRMEVSSQHAKVTLNFWDVCLTDLGSTNGTEIVTTDGRRQRLSEGSTVTIQPGTRIILAEVLEMTFEAQG